jgi:hypothetical protein
VVLDYFATVLANAGHGMTSSSTAVRRDRLLACGGFDESVRIGEDADTWARLAWSGAIGYVAEPLSVHVSDVPGSLVARAHEGLPERPPYLDSYAAWSAKGCIPPRLAESSRRLGQRVRFEWAASLARRKRLRVLWRAIRSDEALPLTWPQLAGLALRGVLPLAALERLRRPESRDRKPRGLRRQSKCRV